MDKLVPNAITVRLAISIVGDCDTTASMSAGVAEAFYGAPDYIVNKLDEYLTRIEQKD